MVWLKLFRPRVAPAATVNALVAENAFAGAGLQRAHIDVGRAGIVAAARERQRASAGLGQATAAGEGGGERDVVAVGVEGRPAGAEGGQL